jgi:hypothetical protein
MGTAGEPQGFDRAAGVRAVAKVVAHHDVPYAQTGNHQVFHEALRRHAARPLIETQSHQPIHTARGKRKIFLAPTRQARRRTCRIDELLGTGFKY